MRITRRVDFSACHACGLPDLTEEQNYEIYGEASRLHGHNFMVEVTLEGEPDPVTGMVYDLKRLKEILHREVIELLDHRNLNAEIEPFQRIVPTAENLARLIWDRVAPYFQDGGPRLSSVRVHETEDLYVEYMGEE